jgi:hypothetical protein
MHSTCNHFLHCAHCMVSSAAEYPLLDSPHPSQSTSLGGNSGVFGCKWHGGECRDVNGARVDNVAVDSGDGCGIVMLAGDGDRDADGVAVGLEDGCEIVGGEDGDRITAGCARADVVVMDSGDGCKIITLTCGGDKDGDADVAVMGLEDSCGIVTPSCDGGRDACDVDRDADGVTADGEVNFLTVDFDFDFNPLDSKSSPLAGTSSTSRKHLSFASIFLDALRLRDVPSME